MYRFLLVLAFLLPMRNLCAQCLTDFDKLIPDPTKNFSENFGDGVAIRDNIMVVGASASDTLARVGGIAYLYEKINGEWTRFGVLSPRVPKVGLQFGSRIKITADYILIGCNASNAGVYIFRKPASGWTTMTETSLITRSETTFFGVDFDLSEDQQTLVISNPIGKYGSFFVYHKLPIEEWSNTSAAQAVTCPHELTVDFALGGVKIRGNKIAAAAPYGYKGSSIVYIYSDASGTFKNFRLEAELSPAVSTEFQSGRQFEFTSDGIFTSSFNRILYYAQPASGTWVNSEPTCIYSLTSFLNTDMRGFYLQPVVKDNQMYIAAALRNNTGKVIKITNTTGSWCGSLSEEVIYTDPAPASGGSSMFNNVIVCSNQNDLAFRWVSSPDNPKIPIALATLQQENDGTWKKQTLSKSLNSAGKFSHGTAMFQIKDFLFVSALGERLLDREIRGVVYIYKKTAGTWNKVNKLDQTPTNADDNNFGNVIGGYGNTLVITGPGYNKIFLYAGNNEDFTNPALSQTIMPVANNAYITSLGAVVMDKDWMVVSTQSNIPSDGVRSILMFYKKDTQGQWVFDQDLNMGSPSVFGKGVASIDLENQTALYSNGYNNAQIILYNIATAKWEQRYTLAASDPDKDVLFVDPRYGTFYYDGSGFGYTVDLDGDRIFISAPLKNSSSKDDVGAVYVYVKNPGASWFSGRETAKLVPVNKIERTLFGKSIKAFNNTLIVGAPGATTNINGSTRQLPGSTFVIQSKDYRWQNTIPLVELTGDTFIQDYFGYEVGVDEDDFFIASPLEDNASGRLAGTVYVSSPPPIVKLEGPICVSSGQRTLLGYPFNGTWSGKGIVNTSKGLFDPALAGVGTHEISYKTPNCYYTGKMLIEVVPDPVLVNIVPLQQTVCKVGKTAVNLSVSQYVNMSYRWYYRAPGKTDFIEISNTASSITVGYDKVGEYKVDGYSPLCIVSSPIFIVAGEEIDLEIEPIHEVCDPDAKVISINANYSGGSWQAIGFSANYVNQPLKQINVATLANGKYSVGYTYTSSNGCMYTTARDFVVNKLSKPVLSSQGNLCTPEGVALQTNVTGATDYIWMFKSTSGSDSLLLKSSSNSYKPTKNGMYYVVVKKGEECSATSTPISINNSFLVELLPDGNSFKTCSLIPFSFSIAKGNAIDHYQWIYSKDAHEGFEEMSAEGNTLPVKQTGYYRVNVTRGMCKFETEAKFVEYSRPDTIYIPNVFTPNNDGHNDIFKVVSTYGDASIKILNRYGSEVFRGGAQEGWHGGDFPSGVYYWLVTFVTCDNKRETMKGYVHLVR